ncbi:MAG: glycerol-3-phosphate 1-O-acyltransferase PlsY [Thermodesulfovibrionia bacterium]|nr:glycerol-3-phosphate 1-O-acyltransferase PlsY [Thermodesulfovibrionia bacterium]
MSLRIYLYLLIPLSYLIGSIPFGVIISKAKGIDIRSTGSGNIGATNVLRGVGKLPALLTLVCDILKGAAPFFLLYLILGERGSSSFDLWGGMAALAVVAGHLFPVFLSFKGGKGVATGLGVMLFYSPITLAVMVIIWLVTAAIARYSSLSAITAYSVMPIILALSGASFIKVSFGLILAMMIVLKHASNIKRLCNGAETKIGGSKG